MNKKIMFENTNVVKSKNEDKNYITLYVGPKGGDPKLRLFMKCLNCEQALIEKCHSCLNIIQGYHWKYCPNCGIKIIWDYS